MRHVSLSTRLRGRLSFLCLIVSLVLLPRAGAAASTIAEFDAWMAQHHKMYGSADEKAQRYQHWLEAYERVQQHAHPHYSLGLNEMSDWSPAEHAQRLQRGSALHHHGSERHIGFHIPAGWRRKFVEEFGGSHPRVFDGRGEPPPPPEVDWRDPSKNPRQVKGVTSIRNQLFCGGCYSFGVVAAVEGVVAADRGFLNALSDEQIIDCDAANHGCEGGDPQIALTYVVDQPLVAKGDYPFNAGKGHASQCALNEAVAPASQIQSYLYVQPCEETVLMQAVARGPVVVAIDAYCDAFMQYSGGVLSDSCVDVTGAAAAGTTTVDAVCEDSLNHAVAIVGYGVDGKTGLNYWIIKNSWGSSWGEKGFARVLRGGGREGEEGKDCGVGCLEYYNFLPTGGVAFVNGTALSDDDFPKGNMDEDAQRKLFFMDFLVGMAVVLAVLMVVGVPKLRRPQIQPCAEPLLQLEEEENGNDERRVTTLAN
eukprot:evm.model.NODE_5619_length_9381_cov_52.491951.2